MKQLHQSSPETPVRSGMKTLSLDTHGGSKGRADKRPPPYSFSLRDRCFCPPFPHPLSTYLEIFSCFPDLTKSYMEPVRFRDRTASPIVSRSFSKVPTHSSSRLEEKTGRKRKLTQIVFDH